MSGLELTRSSQVSALPDDFLKLAKQVYAEDLIGSLEDARHPRVPVAFLDGVLVVDAAPTVHLQDFTRGADRQLGCLQLGDRGLGHRIATDASGDFAREFETAGALDVIDLDHLEATCVDLSDALEASQTTVALSWSPAVAYGCSVLMPSHQTVLFPRYDRRTWGLERTLGITQTSWVVWGHGRDGCDFAPADGSVTCAIWADDVAVMTTPARAWNKMVHPLGMGVRPFPEGWPN